MLKHVNKGTVFKSKQPDLPSQKQNKLLGNKSITDSTFLINGCRRIIVEHGP